MAAADSLLNREVLHGKLRSLVGTQQSIESTSSWCLFFAKEAGTIVEVWLEELLKVRARVLENRACGLWVLQCCRAHACVQHPGVHLCACACASACKHARTACRGPTHTHAWARTRHAQVSPERKMALLYLSNHVLQGAAREGRYACAHACRPACILHACRRGACLHTPHTVLSLVPSRCVHNPRQHARA